MWQVTPSSPSSTEDIVCWKTSGAEHVPKGRWLKQYLPNGVTDVVSKQDSSSSGTCQNPEFASNFENSLLFLTFARFSSTEAIGWTSRLMALVRLVRSTHILMSPFLFVVITMPEHQSVGTVTGEITSCTMLSNFSFTLGRSGCGTCHGVYKHTGTAFSLSGIRYSCPISPRPLKSLGYSTLKSGTFSTLCSSGAGVSNWSACIAGLDRRLFAWLVMTYTFFLWLRPPALRVVFVI